MKYTIISDCGCCLKSTYFDSSKFNFFTVPLTIILNDKEIVDVEDLDTKEFVKQMKANKSAPKTACPPPEAFAEKIREANDNVFVVTITSKLSGTYNSARLAAETVRQENSKKKIYVLDSLSASAAIALMIYKLIDLIESEQYTFEEIVKEIEKVRSATRLRFFLQDFGNLLKTGRMSKVKGIIATALNIKLLLGEDGEGEIKQCAKAFGTKRALHVLSDFPAEKVKTEGENMPIVITHCQNEEGASFLKKLLETKFGLTNIKILLQRGLACFYAGDQGILLGY